MLVLANPTYLVGLSYSFSGDFGVTVKVLSNDERDEIITVAGVTYYPFSEGKLGIDLGAGYANIESVSNDMSVCSAPRVEDPFNLGTCI